MTQNETKIYTWVAILAVLTIIANLGRIPNLAQIDHNYVNRHNPVDLGAITPDKNKNPHSDELEQGSEKKDQQNTCN